MLQARELQLADALRLPTFSFHGQHYYRRLTLIIGHDVIKVALYPVLGRTTIKLGLRAWLRRPPEPP